jgi:hydroxymethylpyrimidine/phosphomethylpyrimidine kinase
MAKGNSLEKACLLATELTHKAIKNAVKIGQGQNIISF